MTQTIQYESPAALGRKARIDELVKLVQAERLNKSEQQIIALYQMQSGLRVEVVRSYIKLIYASGLYKQPDYLTDKILTEAERIPMAKARQRKQDIEDTMRELAQDRYHSTYLGVLEREHPGLRESLQKEAERIVDASTE